MGSFLVTGARGQLGADLGRGLAGRDVALLDRSSLDLRDTTSIERRIREIRPAVVFNAAAYNAVDLAEDEPEEAFRVNALGPRALAEATAAAGALLVHFSTNYVFDGDRRTPYLEEDPPLPRSAYAVSKLAGELFVRHHAPLHLVVRTSGLYGLHGQGGKGRNFVDTMLRLGRERERVEVVEDQLLTPTFTEDLAEKVVEIVDRWLSSRSPELLGLYHVTNSGEVSWFGFAREIFRRAGLRIDVIPVSSRERIARANRPAYAVLADGHLRRSGFEPLRHWQDALADYLERRINPRTDT